MQVENVVEINELIEFATNNQDVKDELGIRVDELSMRTLITWIFYDGTLDCDQAICSYDKKHVEDNLKRLEAERHRGAIPLNEFRAYKILHMFLNKNDITKILMTCE